MTTTFKTLRLAGAVAAISAAGCATPTQSSQSPTPATSAASGSGAQTPAAQARADRGRPAYTRADVAFMQGMIGHHAQAVVMAGWAPSHGARNDVLVLAQRIDVAQRDEMAMMERWLRERGETVPDAKMMMEHAGMDMPGMKMMPGMLTPEQMAQLDKARGPEFDRLFLTFMMQHHQGALTMVGQLLSENGAAQDPDIYRFATDVNVDQITEIDRMKGMLSSMQSTSPTRTPPQLEQL
jgi:uncharacterized protein (DUF305 family)